MTIQTWDRKIIGCVNNYSSVTHPVFEKWGIKRMLMGSEFMSVYFDF
jgi:hypothetical protein